MKLKQLLLAGLFALTALATAQTPSAADDIRKLEALLPSTSAEKPGCAIGISQNGQKLLERAFGLANLEHGVANTPQTIFEAGSVSKQFTAAAILLLGRDGKLKLSDDIRKYLPEMPNYGTPVTVEMLLNHTSGLRDWGSVASAAGKPRGERNFSNAEVLDIASRQKALNYKPGAEYSYTNTGYNLAAEIVVRVSGKSFQEFSRERIFAPLGMTNSQWRDDFNRIVKGRAMAYVPSSGGYEQSMPFMNVYGNGGLLTTIGDLTLWNEAMMADKLGLRKAMEKKGVLNDGREIIYARGVGLQERNGVAEIAHSGGTGGYTSWLARYPDKGLSIAILCNSPETGFNLIEPMTNVLLPPTAATQTAGTYADPAAYAGRFVNTLTGFPMTLNANGGALQGAAGPPLARLSETRWRRGRDELAFVSIDRMQINTADGNRFEYVRTPAVTPTATQLAEFAGTYASDEAGATYKVAVESDQLVVSIERWPETVVKLTPSYKDAFTAMGGGVLARFRREGGQVSAMSMGDGRMRDLNAPRVK